MNEAQQLLTRLDNRLRATASNTERQAILNQIAVVKQRYNDYIEEMHDHQRPLNEPETAQPGRADDVPVGNKSTVVHLSAQLNEKGPTHQREMPESAKLAAAKKILERPHEQHNPPATWDELTIQNMKMCEENYQMRIAKKKFPEQPERQRPESPPVAGQSYIDKIGSLDREKQRNHYRDQAKLLDEQNSFQEHEREYKRREAEGLRSLPDYDMDVCKIGQAHHRSYEPVEYEPPARKSVLQQHRDKQRTELQEIRDEAAREGTRLMYERQERERRQASLRRSERKTEEAYQRSSGEKRHIDAERFGSVRHPAESEGRCGVHYDSRNRLLRPDRREDVLNDGVYADDNFLKRICEADERRSAPRGAVLPLSEEELRGLAERRFYKRFPQKRDLSEHDLAVIRGYMEEIRDEERRRAQKLRDQAAYDGELRRHDALRRDSRAEEDKLDRYYGVVNYVPDMVKRVF